MSLRGPVAPVSSLFAVGGLALGSVAVPSTAAVRGVTLAGIVSGDVPLDVSAVVVSGGLLLVGLAAVLYGLVLLFGRV